ncbi:efflux RND transporter periplasmic adaptor subunit [Roseomonas sp. OT10]|uniref:efflux RND transporter periplasmic adaptor subunit n=1 Tax=Roseomonas cutis TaxID=2897332 RepID=UPI001E467B6A|nr:efflux RND transporter periplasmic adaptor subunit [Roseomonas sp. OT10]UFN49613.1 efflux RND transporter periplasmic adaptor subunit [Roseomonas sp. OT10]
MHAIFSLRFRRLLPAVLAALLAAPLRANAQAPTPAQAPAVVVLPVALEAVAPGTEFLGRVEAVNAVDVRSRVEGFLETRGFEEGQMVREGQELFHIESAGYEASLSAAQASLAGAQADLRDAEGRFQRSQELRRTQATSQAVLEENQAARDRARAGVLSAEASLRQAELNLGYTSIRAPFAGRIGHSAFAVGSLVAPSSGPLARIVQTDPIRVVFSVSDQSLLDFRTGPAAGRAEGGFVPSLVLSSGHVYAHPGEIEFIGNEFDPRTGTIPVRARFPNPEGLLVPGQFVTLAVRPAEARRRPVVRLGAVQLDREGRFVLLVDEQDRVVLRRIRVGAQIGQNWVVEDGLRGGERVIVQGFQNARPGAPVRAVPATEGPAGPGAARMPAGAARP